MATIVRSNAEANKIGALIPDKGFKNFIINGGFDIWQRGTSFDSVANGTYTVDRGVMLSADGNTTTTVEKTNNGISIEKKSGTSGFGYHQFIEIHKPLTAGTILTLSVKGTHISGLNKYALVIQYRPDSKWDTAKSAIGLTDLELNGGIQSTSVTLPEDFSQGDFVFKVYNRTSDDSLGKYELNYIQLEESLIATPFEHRPYGLELSLCQRYFEVGGNSPTDRYNGVRVNTSVVASGTQFRTAVRFANRKRGQPTITVIDNDGTEGQIGLENTNGSIVANETPDSITRNPDGFIITHDLNDSSASGIRCGWTADAEL